MLKYMTQKKWVIVILSFIIALLYSLPWLVFRGMPEVPQAGLVDGNITVRVSYLFVTVFLTSLFFFCADFILANLLREHHGIVWGALYLAAKFIVVIVCSAILVVVATFVLEIRAPLAYFTFYLVRNAILAIIVGLFTYVVDLIEKLDRERMEVLTLESKNTESELAALRSQLDPHFIFNTLSTLGGLIHPRNQNALTFLDHLADTFRYILEKRSDNLVSVKEELDFLHSYLYMMNSRFADAIRVTIDAEEVQSKLLPQFAIQIAVENAIKHNMVSAAHPLEIEISGRHTWLLVKNPVRKVSSVGYGIGLANLSKRYVLSGSRNIEIRNGEGNFELYLPLL
jgi:Putative regulator of cell autolysis